MCVPPPRQRSLRTVETASAGYRLRQSGRYMYLAKLHQIPRSCVPCDLEIDADDSDQLLMSSSPRGTAFTKRASLPKKDQSKHEPFLSDVMETRSGQKSERCVEKENIKPGNQNWRTVRDKDPKIPSDNEDEASKKVDKSTPVSYHGEHHSQLVSSA